MGENGPRLAEIAGNLLAARSTGRLISAWPEALQLQSFEQAYAVQALQMQCLGEIGGWKVGAASPEATPTCAPLPKRGVYESRALPPQGYRAQRRVEVELGFRIAADLPPKSDPYSAEHVWCAVGQTCVAVEIVESRYVDSRLMGRLSTLADLASHGGLVYRCSPDVPALTMLDPETFSLRVGKNIVSGPSTNPAGDPLRLLTWLANHGSHHLGGLRSGQVVITGSALPLLTANPGDVVHASIKGLGELDFIY